MTTTAIVKAKRVNPIKVRREREAQLAPRYEGGVSYSVPERSEKVFWLNWIVGLFMAVIVVGAGWSLMAAHNAEVRAAAAEAKAEVMEDVVDDLRTTRDADAERRDQPNGLGELIISFFSGVFTILNAMVWGLIDAFESASGKAPA